MEMKLSEVIALQMSKLNEVKITLSDIGDAYPGWEIYVSPIEGLLTCGVKNLRDVKERILKNDNTISIRQEF